MADEKDSSTWKTPLALAGLAVSLFGNWTQYKALDEKKAELQQSQQKIDAARSATEDRKRTMQANIDALKRQMEALDSQIEEQKLEVRRGLMGVSVYQNARTGKDFANLQYAKDIVRTASEKRKQLEEEKKKLQDKI